MRLIPEEDGIHWARKHHAQPAWDFMKQFRRNEQGMIEQVNYPAASCGVLTLAAFVKCSCKHGT